MLREEVEKRSLGAFFYFERYQHLCIGKITTMILGKILITWKGKEISTKVMNFHYFNTRTGM